MGNSASCVSGNGEEKSHPPLCNQDSIDFIVEKTQATKEDVEAYQENFLQQYPDGKIDKKRIFGNDENRLSRRRY